MRTLVALCLFFTVSVCQAGNSGLALHDLNGGLRHPLDPAGKAASVLIFYWQDCPICNTYAPEINRISEHYTNFNFYIVQVDPDLTVAAAQRHARDYDLSPPVLLDAHHTLAKLAKATTAPEAVIFGEHRKVLYRGRIDNLFANLAVKRSEATEHDLRDALDAISEGKPAPPTAANRLLHPMNTLNPAHLETAIRPGRAALPRRQQISAAIILLLTAIPAIAEPPTFDKDIAPIVFKNCAVCHRPGEVAPFSLLDFRDVSKHAKQIARVTGEKIMPPWKAEPGFGEFANDRHLTADQIALFKEWSDANTPVGKSTDLPPSPQFSDTWSLGKPDVVLEPDEDYELSAEGSDIYRCFVIPSNFTEDHFIRALEVQPGNRKVVHHVIVHYDTSGRARELDAQDPGPGYTAFGGVGFRSGGMIGGWAPGNFPSLLPDGIGRLVPKGADIVVQVHYHKSGKPEKDHTKIALYFAHGTVDKRIRAFPVIKRMLRIPPGDSNYVVHASLPVKLDATLYRVTPHMHLLGRDMKVTATLPDGTVVPLVHVENWDFNWQTGYELKTPLKLPAGSHVDLEARYDNSSSNPLNPNNPPKLVTWGEQTTDEMCLAFLSFTLDREHLAKGIAVRGYDLNEHRKSPPPAAP